MKPGKTWKITGECWHTGEMKGMIWEIGSVSPPCPWTLFQWEMPACYPGCLGWASLTYLKAHCTRTSEVREKYMKGWDELSQYMMLVNTSLRWYNWHKKLPTCAKDSHLCQGDHLMPIWPSRKKPARMIRYIEERWHLFSMMAFSHVFSIGISASPSHGFKSIIQIFQVRGMRGAGCLGRQR